MRIGRQLHLLIIAVLLLSSFLFLRSSWSDVEAGNHSSPGWIYEAKEPDVADGAAQKTDLHNQPVLDHPTKSAEERLTSSYSVHPTETDVVNEAAPDVPVPDRVVVIGRLQSEDTSWVGEELRDWQHAIYIVDDTNSTHPHTTMNKGREAMPYLTYLLDHYHKLPSTIAFLHAHRAGYPLAWHNEGEDGYDAVEMLRTLNIDFVQRNGYANLRCIHIPGCPDEIQPFRNPREDHRSAEHAMPDAWAYMFNNTDVPEKIGTPCCAQFAVSRSQVLKRPLSDYQRYMDWLIQTPLTDDVSGRVFEYLWHIIFGRSPVYCPSHEQCYCDVYGRCP
ncbi:uncharacterized protein EI97DRAFT_455142 [Westerdykella ornata]|uniref:DUF3431 domain-containing protein n=1 Tax=Westerdykella ornata TaxID=318751 RepID=A0A6A6JUH8_WESOR|nr:uncharacterized protein EI97DRAFT_455142 [Westerdykella ornata]KAF2280232.1 hypothetical protein EI97DRAFT_455142 [Westerdykella ornata]